MTTPSPLWSERPPVARSSSGRSARTRGAMRKGPASRLPMPESVRRADELPQTTASPPSRWAPPPRAEQRSLRAMAYDADAGSSSGDVAARLGRGVPSFDPARASLISKGLIFAPEHGVVAFPVPGMADFIQRQPDP